ncbi:MAG: hypothetical protein A2V60_00125 [Candidatus Portnoybacteria bacterium RIFCSPHIGHO2_01_FULL_39_19]|nr:MAG: hypothetical protein A2V60_00125 [Candidatus Portnoybacteria bacterium RIFCSPHIGHO2_01_FULL_39_19]
MNKLQTGDFAKIIDVAEKDPLFKFKDQLIGALIRVNLFPPSRNGPYPLVSGTVVLKDIRLNGISLKKGDEICLKASLRKVNPKRLSFS